MRGWICSSGYAAPANETKNVAWLFDRCAYQTVRYTRLNEECSADDPQPLTVPTQMHSMPARLTTLVKVEYQPERFLRLTGQAKVPDASLSHHTVQRLRREDVTFTRLHRLKL